MNWLTFAISAFLAWALQLGLRGLLALPDAGGVAPSFLLILMVFVALHAAPTTAAWAGLLVGLLVDLLPGPIPIAPAGRPGASQEIIGPAAVGYLLGAYAVVQLRGLVFRESLLTLCVLVFVAGFVVELYVVTLYSIRGFGFIPAEPVHQWSAFGELGRRLLRAVYSALFALPLGWLLVKSRRYWAFRKN